ncbi:acetylglutamate kinase [Garciella nitratireducens]|uniref:Acetylglutamate kinase n=1 Tax=Garciella nitratireducens DSM 15102 TaxID=1121911 RepID=A0A1T4NYK7_9FIRM|nr:acetylglutamate kinase [Garciella nitratireducens]SJZ84295.1 N-acetylglutamate kinase [Garciella nitratireducens DSM 15102]
MTEEKISILIEALPYIKKFSGKTFVIKYGGSIMQNEKAQKTFIQDVALLNFVGIHTVIVHGGGPKISNLLEQLKIQSDFIDGLRVTTQETIDIVEMILSGNINKNLTSQICQYGINAIGISGKDSNLITVEKKYLYKNGQKIDIGYVGNIININEAFLEELIQKNLVPIISPIGCDKMGKTYNINADTVAGAVSSALKAEKLILLTDVEGIYKNMNDPSSLLSLITLDEIDQYIEQKIISGGMIPKIQCCIEAIKHGTRGVHLIDGRREHSLLLEIFTHKGIGTMIKKGVNEKWQKNIS